MKKYVSTINNYKIFDFELKTLLREEKETGLKGNDLFEFIKKENSFMLKTNNNSLYNLIWKRYELLSPELKEIFLTVNYEERLIIHMCLLLKSNDLFFDFFKNEILEEINNYPGWYERHRINIYFDTLQEQGIINWKDSSIKTVSKAILNTMVYAKIYDKETQKISKTRILSSTDRTINYLKSSFPREMSLFL